MAQEVVESETVAPVPDVGAIRAQFREILAFSDTEPIEDGEVRESSPEERLADGLSGWASRKEATEMFLPWLSGLIQYHRGQSRHLLKEHAALSYELGVEDALSALKQAFIEWAGRS